MHSVSLRNILFCLAAAVAMLSPRGASALDPDFFPAQSVLAQGRWVKVSVEEEGLYRITAQTLRSWGFSDPSRVRVFGFGGARMADELLEENIPADLPMLQSALADDGTVVFYAQGAGEWVQDGIGSGRYYYAPNLYTSRSYYFVTETDSAAREVPAATFARPLSGDVFATEFTERLHHESELFSPGESGPLLLGEDMRYTRERSFDFRFPAPGVANAAVAARVSFVSKITSGAPAVEVVLPSTDAKSGPYRLNLSSSSNYTRGTETVLFTSGNSEAAAPSSQRVVLKLTSTSTPTLAALNSLTLSYSRPLELPSTGYLTFGAAERCLRLTVSSATDVTVWDVTDPSNITVVQPEEDAPAGTVQWRRPSAVRKKYAAWSKGATLPAPRFEEYVANQNLHGQESPDMVILAPAEFLEQAQRLADFHATGRDSLRVVVEDIQSVYNEFSSGRQDPAAIRNYMKMLYDRGLDGTGRPLRYLLLMARMTIDNRHLLSVFGSNPTIPGWTPATLRSSLSDNEGYFTDDFYALLDDGACTNMRSDKLRIAVGRIPVIDVTEARNLVDKELEYARSSRHTAWRQRAMFLADDGNAGVHLTQSEDQIAGYESTEGSPFITNKVYLEAYTRQGGVYPEARDRMFKALDEGVVWWNYIGHANTTGWTADGQLSYTDINSMYLRNLPFIYAATCEFLRVDASDISGAEIMYKERYGGCIGVISASRPVYIAENGPLSAAIGRAMAVRDASGRIVPPGEVYRLGKNDIRDRKGNLVADDNRFRYIFVGDPALRLAVPDNTVVIDSINGIAADADDPAVVAALSRARISGRILAPDGALLDNFHGTVTLDIMDAEFSTTTTPEDDSDPETFEEIGARVFVGSAPVAGGRFELVAPMPAEFAQNYRPATIGAYAYAADSNEDAAGLFRNFYLYGYDEEAAPDTERPVIESMVLNHSSFQSGDFVNADPMLIAAITDNVGINLSSAGIGHQISATLDGTRTFNNLSTYYTPYTDGTPGGIINYPFENLTEGSHTLALRIWDTSGNSARAEIDFNVAADVAPKIYDIYSDANPASSSANFYLSHDQPDAMVDVTVTVYNLLGRPVWSGSVSGRSDMFLSVPVTWDLTDSSGRRVPRGIYLYRATISAKGGSTYETASRRIAVTAQ